MNHRLNKPPSAFAWKLEGMATIAARQAALALARISSSRPSAQAGSLIHRRGLASAAGNQFFYIYLPYTCSLCLHLTLLNPDLIYNVSILFFSLSNWFTADHHGPPKVNLWQDPMSPSKWKEEHVSPFSFNFHCHWCFIKILFFGLIIYVCAFGSASVESCFWVKLPKRVKVFLKKELRQLFSKMYLKCFYPQAVFFKAPIKFFWFQNSLSSILIKVFKLFIAKQKLIAI